MPSSYSLIARGGTRRIISEFSRAEEHPPRPHGGNALRMNTVVESIDTPSGAPIILAEGFNALLLLANREGGARQVFSEFVRAEEHPPRHP